MGKNKITEICRERKRRNQGVFTAFTTFGYPSIAKTFETIQVFQDSGVDIIELGVPFSDPLADGPVIQASSQAALGNKITIPLLLKLLGAKKKTIRTPIMLLSYLNPVLKMGYEQFLRSAEGIVEAIGIADLPIDEARRSFNASGSYCSLARKYNLATVFFVTRTTADHRARQIGSIATGFVYYVSASGITGTAAEWPQDTLEHIRHLKKITQKPLLVGFGIKTPDDARKICTVADGVIVGTAIIQKINDMHRRAGFRRELGRFIQGLSDAAHRTGNT